MAVPLQPAKETDIPAIVAMMTAAFRGAEGELAWSAEADYITGVRTSESLS
jgi:pimeloyl-CoA synthetase